MYVKREDFTIQIVTEPFLKRLIDVLDPRIVMKLWVVSVDSWKFSYFFSFWTKRKAMKFALKELRIIEASGNKTAILTLTNKLNGKLYLTNGVVQEDNHVI